MTFCRVFITFKSSECGAAQMRLGNRLRVARAEKRLSQEDLARMAGVTRQTIGAIENGQYAPSALLAFVLAEQLGIPIGELFHLEPKEPHE